MNPFLAIVLSGINTGQIIVQVLVTGLLIAKDNYSMLYAFLFVISLDSLGLLYFFYLDSRHQSQRKVKYWFWNLFQLEVIYMVCYNEVPMSVQKNVAYRAYRENLYAVLNLIFVFPLQLEESHTSYNIIINEYIVLLTRLGMFSIYIYSYYVLSQNWMSFGGFFDSHSIIFGYYLAFGILSTFYVGDEQQYNVGLIALSVIISTNLISMCYNLRFIKDNPDLNLLNTFFCSISCISHYREICSYGEKKPTIVLSYLCLLAMSIALLVLQGEAIVLAIQDFLHQALITKIVIGCSILSLLLCFTYLLRYFTVFILFAFRESSYYIGCEEETILATSELKSKMFMTSQIDILIKYDYKSTKLVDAEEKSLISSGCQDKDCILKYLLLKAVSRQLNDKVIVNIQIKKDQDLDLCDYHSEELISSEEFVYPHTQRSILNKEHFFKNEVLVELVKSRFTNGLYKTNLTKIIETKLSNQENVILHRMHLQSYQVIAFLKHEALLMTMIPGLLLYDLYHLDI